MVFALGGACVSAQPCISRTPINTRCAINTAMTLTKNVGLLGTEFRVSRKSGLVVFILTIIKTPYIVRKKTGSRTPTNNPQPIAATGTSA